MPQLRKVMSAKAQLEHSHQATVRLYGFELSETQVVENSVFLDASGVMAPTRNVGVANAVKGLLEKPDRPVTVTVVLPPGMSFRDERGLVQSIVGHGGSVLMRKDSESFHQIIENRRELTFAGIETNGVEGLTNSTSGANQPATNALSQYFFTEEERLALAEDYRKPDSSSVLS